MILSSSNSTNSASKEKIKVISITETPVGKDLHTPSFGKIGESSSNKDQKSESEIEQQIDKSNNTSNIVNPLIIADLINTQNQLISGFFQHEHIEGISKNCMILIPNSNYLVTGGKDGILKIWDLESKKEIARKAVKEKSPINHLNIYHRKEHYFVHLIIVFNVILFQILVSNNTNLKR